MTTSQNTPATPLSESTDVDSQNGMSAFGEPTGAPAADRSRAARSLFNTIPLVLAGSMAMSLNLSMPLPSADAHEKRPAEDKSSPTELGKSIRESLAAAHAASTAEALSTGEVTTAAVAPTSYTVVAGDSVSGISARYGLATASVLALNGLSWKSVIYPGQVLKLTSASSAPIRSTPTSTATTRYTIASGDTVSGIATKFGISTQSLLSANGLGLTSIIYAGSTLAIPGSSAPASVASAPIAQPAPSRAVASTAHVIKQGETIASIARSYGTSIQALLTANGLGWSSIIYSGRTLVIPSVVVVTPGLTGLTGVTPLTQEMAQNARAIISVGRSLGVNDHGLTIALATAMQESSLRNLDYGDRDSLGLFQQRPSQGWGTPAQVRDPHHSARLFFGGPSGPNRGITPGLLDISNWQSMSLTQAAQAVQRSAYPDAYAKWETSAKAWLAALS